MIVVCTHTHPTSCKLSHSNDVIGACICSNDDVHVNVCGSAHCGCVVNGSVAMAAYTASNCSSV